jgi:hypothetical protein
LQNARGEVLGFRLESKFRDGHRHVAAFFARFQAIERLLQGDVQCVCQLLGGHELEGVHGIDGRVGVGHSTQRGLVARVQSRGGHAEAAQ